MSIALLYPCVCSVLAAHMRSSQCVDCRYLLCIYTYQFQVCACLYAQFSLRALCKWDHDSFFLAHSYHSLGSGNTNKIKAENSKRTIDNETTFKAAVYNWSNTRKRNQETATASRDTKKSIKNTTVRHVCTCFITAPVSQPVCMYVAWLCLKESERKRNAHRSVLMRLFEVFVFFVCIALCGEQTGWDAKGAHRTSKSAKKVYTQKTHKVSLGLGFMHTYTSQANKHSYPHSQDDKEGNAISLALQSLRDEISPSLRLSLCVCELFSLLRVAVVAVASSSL